MALLSEHRENDQQVLTQSRSHKFARLMRISTSDMVGMRREDAQKRDENTRVPDRRSIVPIAPDEAGEDMVLPVFSTIILGIVHRKTVEEELHE